MHLTPYKLDYQSANCAVAELQMATIRLGDERGLPEHD